MNKLVALSELTQWDATPISGDREALLILRESYFRVRLFKSFLSRLHLSSSQLEEKLSDLVEVGMLKRIPPHGQPERCEYVLTARGFSFLPTALSILRLCTDDAAGQRGERTGHQSGVGTVFDGIMICSECGEVVAREIERPLGRAQRKARADRVHSHGPAVPLHCDVPFAQ
jgi:DNA-binding HxlR family transcriptional regulator